MSEPGSGEVIELQPTPFGKNLVAYSELLITTARERPDFKFIGNSGNGENTYLCRDDENTLRVAKDPDRGDFQLMVNVTPEKPGVAFQDVLQLDLTSTGVVKRSFDLSPRVKRDDAFPGLAPGFPEVIGPQLDKMALVAQQRGLQVPLFSEFVGARRLQNSTDNPTI